MPKTQPLPDWTGQDAYIIGGGPSLLHFPWELVRGKNTIGCNQAFLLGPDVCKVCIFGDYRFWQAHLDGTLDLTNYNGWVVSNYSTMNTPPWLKFIPRQESGLSPSWNALAWNMNTGAAAINLALLMGAQVVYLLGFDLSAQQDKTHWHDKALEPQKEEHYTRFKDGFQNVAVDLEENFPGRQIINITDGSSKLTCFPTVHPHSLFRSMAA